MSDFREAAEAALAIIRQWSWNRGDPDGNSWPIYLNLCDAGSQLAMEGISRPENALLDLLCSGHLIAFGDYRWRKFQWHSFYQIEQVGSPIKKRQWQVLADLIEHERSELKSGGFLLDDVELKKLGLGESYPYKMSFSENRFSTSLCPPDVSEDDRAYFEEWFSAWDISIRPEKLTLDLDEDSDMVGAPTIAKGGRRPANWWPDFAEELAVHVHEFGIPEGQGHDGQSALIDAVFARLSERGKTEPGRGTVQPVVNAVLRRIRSAGN